MRQGRGGDQQGWRRSTLRATAIGASLIGLTVGASACGRSVDRAVVLEHAVERAAIASPVGSSWESIHIISLRLDPIPPPAPTGSTPVTVTRSTTAQLHVGFLALGDGASDQRVFPAAGVTVRARGTVRSSITTSANHVSTVYLTTFTPARPSAPRPTPAEVRSVAREAITGLFSFHDDQAVYIRSQPSVYAIPHAFQFGAGSEFGLADSGPVAHVLLVGAVQSNTFDGLFDLPACPIAKRNLLVGPATVTVGPIAVSDASTPISGPPSTVMVDASTMVRTGGWLGVALASGGLPTHFVQCGSAAALVHFRIALVKSYLTGHWLIAEIAVSDHDATISGAPGFGDLYSGIELLGLS